MKDGTQLPIKISPLRCYLMRDISGRYTAGYKLLVVLMLAVPAVNALLCWPPCLHGMDQQRL